MKIKINQILKNFRDYVTTHDYQHTPMLTAYVDIDTTDPKNNRETPAWSIELKNQFKEIKARIDPEQLKRRSVQQRWEKAEERILEHLREQKLTGRSIAFFSDLDDETKQRLDRGLRIRELLKQPEGEPVPVGVQVVLFYAVREGYIDELDTDAVNEFERELTSYLQSGHQELLENITDDWNEDVEDEIDAVLEEFLTQFSTSE